MTIEGPLERIPGLNPKEIKRVRDRNLIQDHIKFLTNHRINFMYFSAKKEDNNVCKFLGKQQQQ